MVPKNRPKAQIKPGPRKGARSPAAVVGTPDHDDQRPPVFSFLHTDRDHDGAWSWPDDAEAGEVLILLAKSNHP